MYVAEVQLGEDYCPLESFKSGGHKRVRVLDPIVDAGTEAAVMPTKTNPTPPRRMMAE